jgi:DnaJ-domain-containing protein 1
VSIFKVLVIVGLAFFLWRLITNSQTMIKSGRFARKLKNKAEPEPAPPKPAAKPAHEVLGVAKGASAEEAKRAYLELVKQVHPDRSDALSPEMKRLAEARTKEINDAYDRFREQSK